MTKETLNKIHNMLCSMEAALITDPVHNKGQVIDCITLIKGAIEAECTAPQVTLHPTAIDLIAAEREKQIRKGYTVEHDQESYPYGGLTEIAFNLVNVHPEHAAEHCPQSWNIDYWLKLCNLDYKERVRISATWMARELERIIHLETQIG